MDAAHFGKPTFRKVWKPIFEHPHFDAVTLNLSFDVKKRGLLGGVQIRNFCGYLFDIYRIHGGG